MAATIRILPSVPRGLFCRPICARAGDGYFAHQVKSDYLEVEGIERGAYAIVKRGSLAVIDALICVGVKRQTFISRFHATGRCKAILRTPTNKILRLNADEYTLHGRVVDVCTGTPSCEHRSPHPVALEEVTRDHLLREVANRAAQSDSTRAAWHTDASGMVTSVTHSWESLTGQTAEEVGHLGWLRVVRPDHRESAVRAWLDAFIKGEPYRDSFQVRLLDGTYREQLNTAVPILDEGGNITGWSGIAQIGRKVS